MDDLIIKFLKEMSLGILFLFAALVLLVASPFILGLNYIRSSHVMKGDYNDCLYG